MPMSPRLLRPRAAVPAGFDPRSISGLALWLDAADANAVTLNGSTVSEWRDKSGNLRHFSQPTAANQPNGTSRTRNSLRVIDFAASSSQFLLGNAASRDIARNIGGLTLFIAAAYDTDITTGGGAFAFFLSRSDNSASSRIGFGNTSFFGGNGITAFGRRNDSDTFAGTSLVGNFSTAPRVFGATYDYQGTAVRLFFDGANVASNTSWLTAGNTPNTASAGASIGSDPLGTGINFDGFIGEVVAYGRVLSASERQAVQNYLGAKWGITLVTPPTASNADAQNWIDRVYANGGTVSASTADAVNTFCNAIDTAGIRDRFYRLNLFCGDQLAAALVPLYRAESSTASVRGNATDTNSNFVDADFNNTGSASGLKGNGTNKNLNTGYPANTLAANNTHLGVGLLAAVALPSSDSDLIGAWNGGSNVLLIRGRDFNAAVPTASAFTRFGTASDRFGDSLSGAVLAAGNIVSAWPTMYRNGAASGATATTSQDFPNSTAVRVFALNNSGNPTNHTTARLGWYSIGATMTASQAVSFNNAITAFNTTLSRT